MLAIDGWCVLERLLHTVCVYKASRYVVRRTCLALSPLCGDLNPEDLLMTFFLVCDLRKLNLYYIQYCLSDRSFGAWPDLDCVSLLYRVIFVSLGEIFQEAILPCFVLENRNGLVIQFLVVLHKCVMRINHEYVRHLALLPSRLTRSQRRSCCLICFPPASIFISLSLLSVLCLFCSSSSLCDLYFSYCCICSLCCLLWMSTAVFPNSNSV